MSSPTASETAWYAYRQAATLARKALCRSCKREARHKGCERVARLARELEHRAQLEIDTLVYRVENARERAQHAESRDEQIDWELLARDLERQIEGAA